MSLYTISLKILMCTLCSSFASSDKEQEGKPNFVMIVADDMGIGDLGCYGNTSIKTPNIDRLAKEGILLTHHLSAAGLCTPSRAALLTGRYPARYGLVGEENSPAVIVHVANRASLPRDEITIAEALRISGYSTGAVGKWHLGSGCEFLGRNCKSAQNYGFESFYGLPFTLTAQMMGDHRFWIFDLSSAFYRSLLGSALLTVITIVLFMGIGLYKLAIFLAVFGLLSFPSMWFLYTHYRFYTAKWWQVSDWMNQNLNGVIVRNGNIVHQKVDFENLTEDFVNESVKFISNHSRDGRPFFLYHAFGHVHVPLFTAEKNAQKSACGRYGDNVEELDQGVGVILEALEENNVAKNTIVYFLSDHGGHLEAVDPFDGQRIGGYNKLFKGGKGMGASEGAIRVPGIFRWPETFPFNSTLEAPISSLDILPTFLQLAGLPSLENIIPDAKPLDGISFASALKNSNIKMKMEKRILIHHCRQAIQALRLITESKIYKMYLFLHQWSENSTQCGWGVNAYCTCYGSGIIDVSHSPILYELVADPYEDYPIDKESNVYKEIVSELKDYLTSWRQNVSYPKSILNSAYNSLLIPWLQPNIYFS